MRRPQQIEPHMKPRRLTETRYLMVFQGCSEFILGLRFLAVIGTLYPLKSFMTKGKSTDHPHLENFRPNHALLIS